MNQLGALLREVTRAKEATARAWAVAGQSDAAMAAYAEAESKEDAAVTACIRELRTLQPELSVAHARAMILVPVAHAKLLATYGREDADEEEGR